MVRKVVNARFLAECSVMGNPGGCGKERERADRGGGDLRARCRAAEEWHRHQAAGKPGQAAQEMPAAFANVFCMQINVRLREGNPQLYSGK